jgi:hypothetical protein
MCHYGHCVHFSLEPTILLPLPSDRHGRQKQQVMLNNPTLMSILNL